MINNVKVEKDIKAKNESLPMSIGKVGEISLWMQKKNTEVAKLLCVVGNELEVVKLELHSITRTRNNFVLSWSTSRLFMSQ